MKKNVGSQLISAQMITASDGSDQTTGTCNVAVEIDGAAGTGGTATHIANGKWEYAPIQADTNGDYLTFQFVITGAITATVQVYTHFPQTVDNNVLAAGASGFAATNTVVDTINTNVGTNGDGLTAIAAVGDVTNLSNLPTIPSNWITAAGINADAITAAKIANNAFVAANFAASSLDGKGDWNTGKTGYSLTATTGLGAQTANITGNLSGSVGSVTGAVGSVTGAVGSVTGAVGSVSGNVDGNVTGSVASNLELGPSEVNAQMVDVMKTDTIADRTNGAPTDTPTFEEAVMYLYSALSNDVRINTTGGTDYKEYRNAAGTIIWRKVVTDDSSTYTEAKGVAGS